MSLRNWSFSRLMVYERCPLQLKLKAIDRMPEPALLPNNPMERGNRIHSNLEDAVRSGASITKEMKGHEAFEPLVSHVHKLYVEGRATVEQDWFSNDGWEVCDKSDLWLWTKLDLNVTHEEEGHSIVADYKTGRSQYKLPEHVQQCQLYAGVVALRQPEVTKITAELWYVDEGWIKSMQYTREQALKFIGMFDKRARPMFTEKLWRARPNAITCKYCPYSPRGTGACPVGV